MFDRILTPIIAIGLAFLVWTYTRSRDEDVLDNYHVPVELSVVPSQADGYELETDGTASVPVSFVGPPSRVRELRTLLQHGEIKIQRTVGIPEEHQADARFADVIKLDTAGLTLPPGVRSILAENHGRVHVTLRKVVEKQMLVRLRHTGGNRLDRVVCEPARVLVRGPKELLDRDEYVDTQMLNVSSAVGTTELSPDVPQRVAIVREINGRPIQCTPGEVTVHFVLLPRQKTHEIEVPIHFLCPLGFGYRPQFTSEREGRVVLRVQGPASEQRPQVHAYVDLTARRFSAGLHAAEPIQVQLPPGFSLAQEPPRLTAFKLVPIAAEPIP